MSGVLLVSGSLRAGSTNAAALRAAHASQHDTLVFDGLAQLPFFNPDDDPDGGPVDPAVQRWRAALDGAGAVLFCTPEYAGALPGVLKNALEWTVGATGGLHGKPVGYVNVGTGPTRAADAHDSLRKVWSWIGAQPVEAACRDVPLPRSAIDEAGEITDPAIRGQIAEVVGALRGAGHDDQGTTTMDGH